MNMIERSQRMIHFILEKNWRILVFFLVMAALFKMVYLFASSAWWFDEFFFIEGGKTLINGGVLYKDFGDIKPFGLYAVFAVLISLFGYVNILITLKIFVIVIEVLSAFLIFSILRKLFSTQHAFITSAIFLLALSLNFRTWSIDSHLFFIPVSLTVLYFIISDFNKGKTTFLSYFLGGFFCGITYLLASNAVLFALLFPILSLILKEKMKDSIQKNFIAFTGFLVPITLVLIYFWVNQALPNWYWWNFDWAFVYSKEKPFFFKMGNFFATFILLWEWIPLYFLFGLGFYWFIKKRKDDQTRPLYLLLISIFVISLLVKFFLKRPAVSFNYYLLPAMIFFICYSLSFLNFSRLKKMIFILFTGLIFITSNIIAVNHRYDIKTDQKKDLYLWIQNNSKLNDKIYIWDEGDGTYFYSHRSMATSFFAGFLHLDYPAIFNKNANEMDYLWNKFLIELYRDKPVLIVDIYGNFSMQKHSDRNERLAGYLNQFIHFIKNHYELVPQKFEMKSIEVWKLKKGAFN